MGTQCNMVQHCKLYWNLLCVGIWLCIALLIKTAIHFSFYGADNYIPLQRIWLLIADYSTCNKKSCCLTQTLPVIFPLRKTLLIKWVFFSYSLKYHIWNLGLQLIFVILHVEVTVKTRQSWDIMNALLINMVPQTQKSDKAQRAEQEVRQLSYAANALNVHWIIMYLTSSKLRYLVLNLLVQYAALCFS